MLNALVLKIKPLLPNGLAGFQVRTSHCGRTSFLKYGVDKGGWFTKNGKGAFGVGLWKDNNKKAVVLNQFSNCVVGDRKHFLFWKDIWCGMETLSETFHNIYTMIATKDAYLEDLWD